MSSYSESEGEIVESDTEKATTALPKVGGTKVDSRTRNVSASKSPNPPSDIGLFNARLRSRSRSRSPFRAPRGEKRRRDYDEPLNHREKSDSRRFKVRYEKDAPSSRGRYDTRGGKDRYRDKRQRTRSRSPYRVNHPDRRSADARDGRDGRVDRPAGRSDNADERLRAQSVSETGETLPFARNANQRAETGRVIAERRNISLSSEGNHPRLATTFKDVETVRKEDSTTEPSRPLDEAALIEERRKRREAIKAKYKGQATPLLVQALHLGNDPSHNTTKDEVEDKSSALDSPKISSPSTPTNEDAPGSPDVLFRTDEDLANPINVDNHEQDANEPSAVDYDPTMDMNEDRLKLQKRQIGNEVPALTYDKTQPNKQEVLPQPGAMKSQEQPSQTEKNEFDMFAEDDDDMFAPEPAIRPVSDIRQAHARTVPQAKALDMNLLDNWDDPEGYYKVILGELIDGRYHVQANLGRGMFSGVVRALDTTAQKLVAVKIIRTNEIMKKAGLKEIEILNRLAAADPEDKKHLIRLERSFEHKGHLCMVFENLSINLREVLKKFGRDVGINLKAVRSYAQQMFLGLSLLRKTNILHADLKPDNVLVNEARNVLKICDLGSAADAGENEITPYLVSRFYRAPEIILGCPYDFAIDTWSIGCTLFELYTGKILFTGRTNNQMLRSIMECRGKFPLKMLKRAEFAEVHFDPVTVNFRSVERDRVTGRDVVRIMNFLKPTRDLKSRLMGSAKGMSDSELKDLNLFADLLDRCLSLNPEKRCTPNEALRHPFIMRAKV